MHDREDGCFLIALSVCISLTLTALLLVFFIGDPPLGFILVCAGAWAFTFALVLAEGIRDQFRRPRR